MAKRRYEFDEAKYAHFLKEGRGQGTGIDYLPWLTIYDVPSQGRVARIPGIKSGRLHHTLSDIESGLLRLLDWSDKVIDIREQFPLDRDITRQIAGSMGVVHPRDPKTGVDIVMTTDILVDVNNMQGCRRFARAVKLSTDLDDPRTIEKLEIERRYWEQQVVGTDWGIVTEQELPKQRIANITWACEMYSLGSLTAPYKDYWPDRCARVLDALEATPKSVSIKEVLLSLEVRYGFLSGEGLTAIRHMIATKVLAIDMDKSFSVSGPVSQIQSIQRGDAAWIAA